MFASNIHAAGRPPMLIDFNPGLVAAIGGVLSAIWAVYVGVIKRAQTRRQEERQTLSDLAAQSAQFQAHMLERIGCLERQIDQQRRDFKAELAEELERERARCDQQIEALLARLRC